MTIFNLFKFLEINGINQGPDDDIEIWTNFPLYVQDMLLILIIIGSIITICLFVIIYYLKKLTNKEEKKYMFKL